MLSVLEDYKKKRNTMNQALLINGQYFDNTLVLTFLLRHSLHFTEFTLCKCIQLSDY